MDLRLKGLTAVVTGGTGGIGGAVTTMLAGEGCDVAFCSRSHQHVDAVLAKLSQFPVRAYGRALDVQDAQAFELWLGEIQRIDILVLAVSAIDPSLTKTFAVDIQSTVRCIELANPYLSKSRHAAITYIGSLGSKLAMPTMKPYGIAKAGMAHYMKSLARELAPDGIRVNTVSPGYTEIEGGTWARIKSAAPDAYHAAVRNNPLGRLATGEEIARVVAFISSPAASFVTGADWFVDGAATVQLHS